MFATLLLGVAWLAGGVLAALVGYLLLLTGLACFAPRRTPLPNDSLTRPDGGPTYHRFAILVPAHNEELLLPQLLGSLRALNYPAANYAIFIVADNCTDRTAQVGRAAGAVVYERTNAEQRGKGYALQWLQARLQEDEVAYDAAVILDADSVVSANFLAVMNAQLQGGARAVQAYYAVLEDAAPAHQSWGADLRAAALTVLHYLRPQGRMVAGASVGLKGNGMVFHRDLLRDHAWSSSVTEDIEYHMTLLLAGERVVFAPDAVVRAEMPASLAAAKSQNVRWEQGRVEMARRYLPKLLRAALTPAAPSRLALLDAAVEHVIPPFSILAAASLLYSLLALAVFFVTGGAGPLLLAIFVLLGQAVYLLVGMTLARASRRIFLALLYAPLFLVWKVWLYVRVLLKLDRQGWVRTARNAAHTE